MGKLIYLLNTTLDGFVEAPDHSLDWTVIDDELHSFFNEQERSTAASLYGRGMWETMSPYWPTAESDPEATAVMKEYGRIWVDTPKIVFSSTLESVEGNARLVANADIHTELAKAREEFSGDLAVSGATLASAFVRAGLVDEYRLVVHPVVIGQGTPFFPRDLEQPLKLRQIDSRRFQSGAFYLAYEAA
jgi:dihydrofolate reductase